MAVVEGGTVAEVEGKEGPEGEAEAVRRPVWKRAETTREVTSRVWVFRMSKSCTHIPSNDPPVPAPVPILVPVPVPAPFPVPTPVPTPATAPASVPDTTGGSSGATIAYIRVIVRSGGMTLSLPSPGWCRGQSSTRVDTVASLLLHACPSLLPSLDKEDSTYCRTSSSLACPMQGRHSTLCCVCALH